MTFSRKHIRISDSHLLGSALLAYLLKHYLKHLSITCEHYITVHANQVDLINTCTSTAKVISFMLNICSICEKIKHVVQRKKRHLLTSLVVINGLELSILWNES